MGVLDEKASSVFLLDNGSLRPAATLGLRAIARALSERTGVAIEPVSLLHASAVPVRDLGGTSAEIFESATRARYRAGIRRVFVLPLFFGPSAALTTYLPERIARLEANLPGVRVRVGRPLIDLTKPIGQRDDRMARILSDHVREAWMSAPISSDPPRVILVDHGSPQPAVAAVRDHLATQLREITAESGVQVTAASMERRPGPEYDFNEPLLAAALELAAKGRAKQAEAEAGASPQSCLATIAMLFFSAGRHAGPGGDIEAICRVAENAFSGLRTVRTRLVGEHPLLLEILADRLREVTGDPAAADRQTAD